MNFRKLFSSKGFTLIELLIVIALLGVLAAVVLVAVNPAEQLARGRDASRLQQIASLGHAMQAYVTLQGSLPAVSTLWQQVLVNSGDLKITQTVPGVASSECSYPVPASQGNICYVPNGTTEFVIWTGVESGQYKTKAGGNGQCPTGRFPYFIYDSIQGKAGVGCGYAPGNPMPPINIALY